MASVFIQVDKNTCINLLLKKKEIITLTQNKRYTVKEFYRSSSGFYKVTIKPNIKLKKDKRQKFKEKEALKNVHI